MLGFWEKTQTNDENLAKTGLLLQWYSIWELNWPSLGSVIRLCVSLCISELRGQDPSLLVHNHRRIDLAQVSVITKVWWDTDCQRELRGATLGKYVSIKPDPHINEQKRDTRRGDLWQIVWEPTSVCQESKQQDAQRYTPKPEGTQERSVKKIRRFWLLISFYLPSSCFIVSTLVGLMNDMNMR